MNLPLYFFMKSILLYITTILYILNITISFAFIDNKSDLSHKSIDWAKENNIINGYSDGSFKPEKEINRAEFIKIISKLKYSDEEIMNCDKSILYFKDFDKNSWYAPYVCIAYKKGVVKGYNDGLLKLDKEISIAEAAKIIVLSLIFNKNIEDSYSESWYNIYFNALNYGYIPETFSYPSQSIKRGEIVELLYRIENKISDEPSRYYDSYDETFKKSKDLIVGRPKSSTLTEYHYFNSHYAVNPLNGKMIYFGIDWRGRSEILYLEGIDFNSFEIINEFTAKDKNHMYYKGEIN